MIIQFIIILAISYLGEILSVTLNLPVPGTIIGMLILFLCLQFKIIKVKQISEFVNLLLINMALFFIPPGIKLINTLDYMEGNWFKFIILIVLTTIISMSITGIVVQFLIKKGEKNGNN